MLPASLIVIPFFIGFSTFGLINHRLGLVLANAAVGVPFATWLMKGFFDGIPREIELAAMLDGCNGAQAVWYVVLPLARPGLAACATYLAIVTWSDFVFARTLVTDPDLWMLTVGMQSFLGAYLFDWPSLRAVATLSLVPVFVLFLRLETCSRHGCSDASLTTSPRCGMSSMPSCACAGTGADFSPTRSPEWTSHSGISKASSPGGRSTTFSAASSANASRHTRQGCRARRW